MQGYEQIYAQIRWLVICYRSLDLNCETINTRQKSINAVWFTLNIRVEWPLIKLSLKNCSQRTIWSLTNQEIYLWKYVCEGHFMNASNICFAMNSMGSWLRNWCVLPSEYSNIKRHQWVNGLFDLWESAFRIDSANIFSSCPLVLTSTREVRRREIDE